MRRRDGRPLLTVVPPWFGRIVAPGGVYARCGSPTQGLIPRAVTDKPPLIRGPYVGEPAERTDGGQSGSPACVWVSTFPHGGAWAAVSTLRAVIARWRARIKVALVNLQDPNRKEGFWESLLRWWP